MSANAAAKDASTATGTVGSRLAQLAQSLQFAWFVGHLNVLIFSLLYFLLGRNSAFYVFAYLGVLSSFGIITFQQRHVFQIKGQAGGASSVLQNENVLYLLLSLVWLFTPVYSLSLLPFAIFALFHVLIYLENNLPVVFGPFPPAGTTQIQAGTAKKVVTIIAQFIERYNERCMHWVGNIELFSLIVLNVRALLCYRRSWIVLALYALFVKIRYENSKYMRVAFAQWRVRADGVIAHPSIPPFVKQLYNTFKGLLLRLSQFQVTAPVTQQHAAPASTGVPLNKKL